MGSVRSYVDCGDDADHEVLDVVPVVWAGVVNAARVIDDETDVQQTRLYTTQPQNDINDTCFCRT